MANGSSVVTKNRRKISKSNKLFYKSFSTPFFSFLTLEFDIYFKN
jgi:hypothetical protein